LYIGDSPHRAQNRIALHSARFWSMTGPRFGRRASAGCTWTCPASRSISRGLAFAIFVGSTSLHGAVADAFTAGLHAAFYASMGFMALAAGLSALRAGSSRV
jgi:hypothetical protein